MPQGSTRIWIAAVAFAIVAANDCAWARTTRLHGTWGGNQAFFEVHDRHADLTVPCGAGHVGKRIILDRKGRFNISGTYTHLRGARPAPGMSLAREPVHFRGHVTSKTLELTVEFSDPTQTQTYILTRGVAAQVPLCP